jgi:hypothetical protein
LVADIGDRVSALEEAYMVTTTPRNPGPMTRSIFVIKRVEPSDVFGNDQYVRYGQKVYLEVNPYLFRKTLYLSS